MSKTIIPTEANRICFVLVSPDRKAIAKPLEIHRRFRLFPKAADHDKSGRCEKPLIKVADFRSSSPLATMIRSSWSNHAFRRDAIQISERNCGSHESNPERHMEELIAYREAGHALMGQLHGGKVKQIGENSPILSQRESLKPC